MGGAKMIFQVKNIVLHTYKKACLELNSIILYNYCVFI